MDTHMLIKTINIVLTLEFFCNPPFIIQCSIYLGKGNFTKMSQRFRFSYYQCLLIERGFYLKTLPETIMITNQQYGVDVLPCNYA